MADQEPETVWGKPHSGCAQVTVDAIPNVDVASTTPSAAGIIFDEDGNPVPEREDRR